MELLGLFEGNVLRLLAGFSVGFVVAWLLPSPKFLTKHLGRKRD